MNKRPTFTDREAKGGDIGSRGFEHQKAFMLAKLPSWLASSSFSAVTYELVGDIEVKYFEPVVGELIDFYQVKDKILTPTELFNIIRDFQAKGAEGPFRHFYVVCSGLSQTASPIGEALDRIRREAPDDTAAFYPSRTGLVSNTEADFIARVTSLGGDEIQGRFLLSKVRIMHRHGVTEQSAAALFDNEMHKCFTECHSLAYPERDAIYPRVRALIEGRRGKPISRHQILSAITHNGALSFPSFKQREVHTLHDETPYRGNAIVLPWQRFFGRKERSYPEADEWVEILLGQLRRLNGWLEESASTRNLRLTGQRRLSANMAFGWAFPAVGGYNIIHEHRGEFWRTNRHPTSDTPAYAFAEQFLPGEGEALILSISIGPNSIGGEVRRAVELLGLGAAAHLELHSTDPLTCADQINVAVKNAKAGLSNALRKSGARTIHLFLATPATFALFFGHRLNGVASVQCYERGAPAEYARTCLLRTH
jgi:hypothetical protein